MFHDAYVFNNDKLILLIKLIFNNSLLLILALVSVLIISKNLVLILNEMVFINTYELMQY